ncbi:MAG: heavy metal-responsive transcriptional regulator [Thermomicrobiales bacterium]
MQIGQLAREVGLNPKTLRYYEEIGLLAAARRTRSGYRLYDADALARLRFIVRAKSLGLSLNEIGTILAIRQHGECACQHVSDLLDQKLAEVEDRLRSLAAYRQQLIDLRSSAERISGGRICAIIEEHNFSQTAPTSSPVFRSARVR